MKKIFAFCMAVLTAMLSLSILHVTAWELDESAYPEPDEGFWSTYRSASEYSLDPNEPYRPTVGFRYTDEGFQTVSEPDMWKGTFPKFVVQSSNPVDLSDGFYMQFRVDEFSYKGESGNMDEWISVSISDSRMITHGDTQYGNNWLSLIRGNGDGRANLQSFVTKEKTDGNNGSFNHYGDTAFEIPMDADGREIYELEITYGDDGYEIRINGVTVMGMDTVSQTIASFENCYVGVSFHTGEENGVAGMTILKQGTSKADAVVPTGAVSKEPEKNPNWFADMADPSTVLAGEPALLFDSTLSTVNVAPVAIGGQLMQNADGTWRMLAEDTATYFTWRIRNELSYDGTDFPVMTLLLRNFSGTAVDIFYMLGDTLQLSDAGVVHTDIWDEKTSRWYEDGADQYICITVDMTDKWSGRINGIAPYFYEMDPSSADSAEFDIAYMAFFRSTEEAFAYADAYLTDKLGALPGSDGGSTSTSDSETSEPASDTASEPSVDAADVPTDTGVTLLDPLAGCLITVSPAGTVLGLLLVGGALMLLRKKV